MNELFEKYGNCHCQIYDKKCTITFSNAQGEEMYVLNPTRIFFAEDGSRCVFDAKHRAHIIPKDFTNQHTEDENI